MKKSYTIMKRYCLWLVPVLLMLCSLNRASAQTTYYSKSTGTDFSDPAIWGTNTDGTGTSPSFISSLDSFVVRNNAVLTLSTGVTVRGLNIVTGSLTLSSTTLTVERTSAKNAGFRVTGGTLTISGGSLNVNGSVLMSSGVFNMSSGTFIVDGNNNDASTSVANGTKIFEIASAVTGTVNGGVITIVDPHFGVATVQTFSISGSVASRSWAGNTLRLGDGISTDASSSTKGFEIDCYVGSSRLTLGTLEVNGGSGTNRFATAASASGNGTFVTHLVINSGSEFRNTTTANFHVEGDITNEGTLTVTNTLKLIKADGSAAVTVAQTIGGAGVFRNSTTASTANFASLTINNSNASGVTFANANTLLSGSNTGTVSGTLTLTSGVVHAPLGFVLGTSTATATLSGGSATAYIDGPLTRTFASSRTATGTYTATTLFPVGKTAYLPIWIDPTTTSGGPVQMKAEAFESNSGFGGTGVSSVSQRRWEAMIASGTANFTSTNIQLGDASNIVSASKILQSASASGSYDAITPTILYTAGTPNTIRTTGSQILAASYSGYFSYGTMNPCNTPPDQISAFTVSNLTATSFDVAMTAASSNPTGYLVVRYTGASPVITAPVNGTTYALAGTLGTGTVVLVGSGTTFTQTGRTASTAYTYVAYTYNDATSCYGPQYNTSVPLTTVVTTCATISVPAAQAGKSIGTNSFTASWTRSTTPGVTYFLDVATTSTFTAGTFVPGFEALSTNTDSSYVVTGLTDNTTYYYRVRANSGSCYSQRSSTITVQTTCFPITSLPYMENFDGVTTPALPVCTSREDVNNDATVWATITAPTSPVGYTGNTLRYSYNTSNAANDWFYTNGLALTGGVSYRLTFNYSNNSVATYKEKLKVAYGLSAANAAMTTVLMDSPTVSGNVYRSAIIDFTPASNGTYYIGFQAYSIANQDKLYIDNIKVDVTPTCSEPITRVISNITNTEALLKWSPASPAPSSGYEYYISTSNTAPVLGTTPSGSVSDTFRLMGGLAGNTRYYVWLRSNCGGMYSNWTATADSFTTNCDAAALFSQNFDGVAASTWPACWKKVGTTGTANLQTASNYSAPNCLYIYASSTASLPVVSMPPVNNAGAGTHWLKLRARASSTVGGVIQVGYLTNPNDAASFVSVTSFTASTLTYNVFNIDLGTAPGSNEVLAFRHTGSPANSVLIDEVSWEVKPACIAPTGVKSGAIGVNAATSYWNRVTPPPGSGYDFYISTSNAAPSSSATPSGNVVTDTFVTHSMLLSNTKYFVWVRSNCGGGITSDWTAVADSFMTFCDPVGLPWTENFDALTTLGATYFPGCWRKENGDWATSNATVYNTARSGSNYLRDAYSATNEFIWTPGFSLTAGSVYEFSCWVQSDGTAGWTTDVFVNTSQAAAGATQLGATYTPTGTTYKELKRLFIPSVSGTYNFAIRVNATASPNYLAFDDFKVDLKLCLETTPAATINVSASSATMRWASTAVAPSSGYDYYFGTSNTTPASPTGNVSDTFVNIGSLSSNTKYYTFVRGNCGANGTSAWSVMDSFTTACDPVTSLPYFENFNSVTLPALPSCTKREDVNNDATVWTTVVAPTGYTGNTLRYSYNTTNAANDWFYTNGLSLSGGTSYRITFNYSNNSATTYKEKLKVAYGLSANAAAMTTVLMDSPTVSGNVVRSAIIDFTPASGGIYYFGFQAYSIANQDKLYIDDIRIDITPVCSEPLARVITNITNTSALLKWTAPSTAPSSGYQYYISTTNVAPLGGTTPSGSVATDTFTTINLLSGNTRYYIWMRSNCGVNGVSSWTMVPDSFTTLCDPFSAFPWTEDFDALTTVGATSFPGCWKKENGDWATSNITTSNYPRSGSNFLREAYTATNEYIWTPGFALTAGSVYEFSFYTQGDGNYTSFSVDVFYNTTQSSGGATKMGATYNPPANRNYTLVKRVFVAPTTGTYFFSIRVSEPGTSFYYLGFDDFKLDLKTCVEPTPAAATNVTNVGATIRWKASVVTPSSGYDYYVGTSMSTPTSPTANVTDTFVNVGSLAASTTYYTFIRGNCGVNGTTEWSAVDSFTTACNPLTSLPYFENFNSVTTPTLPSCSKREDVNGDGTTWTTVVAPTTPAGYTGNTLRYSYNTTNAANDWFYTSGLSLTAGTSYRLTFNYSNNSATTYKEKLKVAYGSSASNAAMTTVLMDSPTVSGSVFRSAIIDFTPASSGVYYIGFQAYSIANQDKLYIDDIKVDVSPVCPEPLARVISNVTNAAAVLKWKAPSTIPSAGYEYYISTTNVAPSIGTTPSGTIATDTFTSINLLSGNTRYYVWMRSNCGMDGKSVWTNVDSFTTLCDPLTSLPWTEDFDALTTVGATYFPACWKKENGDWATTSVTTGNTPRSGANHLREGYTATNEYIWTPGFALVAGTAYEFSFYAQGDGNYTTFAVDVFYNNTPSSVGATQMGATYRPPANRVYTLVKRVFVPSSTGTYYFSIRVNEPGTSFYYLGFDDFKLEAKSCVEPATVAITNLTSSAATIRWTPSPIVPSNGYEYYLSTSSAAPVLSTPATGAGITDTFVNVASLPAATKHYVWVRGNCGVNGLSQWKEVADSFTTLCASSTTITENFDGVAATTWPTCWKKVGTTGTTNLQATTPSSAPNCLYIYASSTASLPVVAMPPVSNAGAGTHWLKLKARANFTVGGVIEVGYLTNPEVASSFVSVTSFIANALTYNTYTIDLGIAPGVNQVLAFRHTGSPANSVLIDDVSWEAKPACVPVSGLRSTLITNAGATSYWTKTIPAPASGYDYYISTSNVAPVSGTTPTNTTMLTDSFVTHTGLPASTKHYVWVRANCGSGTTSDWSIVPDSFFTLCNPSGIPYTENFNGVTLPAMPVCGSREDANNDATIWTTVVAPTTPVGYTGNVLRYSYNLTNAANDWFYTAGLSLTAGTNYRLTFNYGNNSTTYTEKLKVAYGTSATNAAMTIPLLNFSSITGNTFQTATIDFVPPTTGVYFIGFQAYSAANQDKIYVDNINVDLGPVCAAPSVISITGLTSATATLNISPLASATGGYEYYFNTSGTAPSSGTTPSGSLTSGTAIGLSGLAVETSYYVWLRSNCGAGTMSDWSSVPTTFITPITSFPYSQNFDGPSNAWSSAIVSGTLNPWVKGTPAKANIANAFSAPNAWVTGVTANYGLETDAALVSPIFDFSSMTEDPVIRFYHNIKSESTYDGGVLEISVNGGVWRRLDSAVGTGTGFNTANSYTWYNSSSANLTPGRPAFTGNSNTVYTGAVSGWVRSATRLTGAAGSNNVRVRFRFASDDLVNDEGWAIDNIEVFQLNAPASPASSVSVSGNQNTQLSVSWTNGGASGRLVVARNTATTAVAPLNWKMYNANAAYKSGDSTGLGNYVVYAGTGTNVVVTGLALNTNYTFDVYELNGELMHVKYAAAASSSGSTLPVKLISFTGKRVSNDASLSWITASETNNKGFEVERSTDGKNFTFVTFVKGALNSNVQQKYNIVDQDAFTQASVLYYRLKQVDVNGKYAYSNTVKISKDEMTQHNQVITYPNPFVRDITVSFSASQGGTANISIVDFMGKTVFTTTAEVKAGNPEISITQLDHLKTGVYIMQVSFNNEVKTVKVVKSE